MSRTFTSKSTTVSGGRGRGTNPASVGRGSITKKEEKAERSRPTEIGLRNSQRLGTSNFTPKKTSTSRVGGRAANKPVVKANQSLGRGNKMYDDDYDNEYQYQQNSRQPSYPRARTRAQRNSTIGPGVPSENSGTASGSTGQEKITQASGFMMVSPNEKKRREITQQAQKNLEDYEKHKEKRKLHHVSYIGTAGGGQISEEEARRKAVLQHSSAAFNSRMKREAARTAEKEREEMVYKDRKTAARRQAELNEEKRKREELNMEKTHREEMRRKNAAFLDRLESKKSQTVSSQQQAREERIDKSKNIRTSENQGSSAYPTNNDNNNTEDLNRLQVMFPHYTRNDLSEILEQMGSLELAIDILS